VAFRRRSPRTRSSRRSRKRKGVATTSSTTSAAGTTSAEIPHERCRDPESTSACRCATFWVVGLHSYIEYPPSYCSGILYVNTFGGRTVALDSHNGHRIWQRFGAKKPSTPAIAGPRLIVSAHDGSVTAYNRFNGQLLWRLHVKGKVESSPVAVGRVVYFGATDGRLFAVYVRTGRVKWAYNTGGRVNSSPSLSGNRIFITTYAGSIFCLRASDAHKIWSTYLKRDAFRYDSFYASPSTDGRRIFTISRSGKIYALSASTGHVIWTSHVGGYGYSTPAISQGRRLHRRLRRRSPCVSGG